MACETPVAVRFTLEDAQRAYDVWGCNCGPGALAAIAGRTLDEVRPHIADFERKRYTNPTMMYAALQRVGCKFTVAIKPPGFPSFGLARIQWEGPWTNPGVPMAARYRNTHWVGSHGDQIFDINCMSVGGWVSLAEWSVSVVPWILNECGYTRRGANGKWHLTHGIEVLRGL